MRRSSSTIDNGRRSRRTDTESNEDVSKRRDTFGTRADLYEDLSSYHKPDSMEVKQYTCPTAVPMQARKAAGSPLARALRMQVMEPTTLRQAAMLQASGACRMRSRFCCSTMWITCVSNPVDIQSISEVIGIRTGIMASIGYGDDSRSDEWRRCCNGAQARGEDESSNWETHIEVWLNGIERLCSPLVSYCGSELADVVESDHRFYTLPGFKVKVIRGVQRDTAGWT
jgi:hypothetical protein